MLTCKLYGRRANQLFQIAAVIGIAIKYELPWAIPWNTINEQAFPHKSFPNISSVDGYISGNNVYNPLDPTIKCFPENTHGYNIPPALVVAAKDPKITACMDGYYQSYKYFEHCKDLVANLLGFSVNFRYSTGVVGIHVRRGDYLNLQDKHPVLPESYYIEAITYFKTQKLARVFRVFSDDIAWCKEFFTSTKQEFKDCHFSFSNNTDEMADLYELYSCDGLIIANSSFSLFAAILSQRGIKTVISPHYTQWFGKANSHLFTADMIPEEFIQLKYTNND